jgi:endonuclease/exonuclease/phosphatase family metal-dependent hydrolase
MMTVATFNMRNANRGDSINGNGWGQRYPYIADMIRFHGFDIFGTQECKDYQLDDLKAVLPGYDYIGVGRDDGKRGGEFAAIFYDTNKFDLLDNGNFWLSTNTEEPNKGWDAALPRICSWGKFKNKKSGFTFYFYNLHMDHIGVEARKESAKLILQKLKELPGEAPMILTGDFNVDQNNESYTLLETSGLMKDAYTKAEFKYAPNGTFNNFKPNLFTESRIDHIFLTPQFKVKKYGILTDTYRSAMTEKELADTGGNFPAEVSLEKNMARTPSDHFPVVAIVECD